MLIRISSQYTAEAPAKGLYDDVREALTWPGILSASVAMGFYYADVEEMGASFLAVADGDPALARRAAQWMAQAPGIAAMNSPRNCLNRPKPSDAPRGPTNPRSSHGRWRQRQVGAAPLIPGYCSTKYSASRWIMRW